MPYIIGSENTNTEPLSYFLPHVSPGVVSTWLTTHIPIGSWILDPFGVSPRLAVEAARSGYRILVTANNPITRFLIEMSANPPKIEDLHSSLAILASSYKANDRMEPYIRSLYNTYCGRCGQLVSADAFYWEQGATSPYTRVYTCPSCGDSGEHPSTPFDAIQAGQFSASGLHKARALERVVASTDQDRVHVEQALSVYHPRALHALITIINKIEGLNIPASEQKQLAALLLYAFDQGNSMWRASGPRERRWQLTTPRHFREINIWLALEQGINTWSTGELPEFQSVPISIWPELPPFTGGICLHDGRLVSIANSLSDLKIAAVCTAIPRPNQAFWTLSALWTGWLWGRDAVGPFKNVLHRQRYDWGWHTTALASVFKQFSGILDPSISIFGLMSEAEPGFIASAIVAARLAGCGLQGIAIRSEEEQAQIMWRTLKDLEPSTNELSPLQIGIEAAREYLEKRGEPASYLSTITAAFINIIQVPDFGRDAPSYGKGKGTEIQASLAGVVSQNESSPSMVYSNFYNSAREALTYRSGFLRFNLQDIPSVESIPKIDVVQETLFPLETEIKYGDVDEFLEIEDLSSENEFTSEKERPTRSSDITGSTYLWLREINKISKESISDQCETTLVEYLSTHTVCETEEVEVLLCESFPGLYTPDREYIRLCLESYAIKAPQLNNRWQLRLEDEPESRQTDLKNALHNILQISEELGIKCIERTTEDFVPSLLWIDPKGVLDYCFFPTITSAIRRIVFSSPQLFQKGFVVLPGSRANLAMYKLQHDPLLSKAFNPAQGKWQFLKFRHLKALVENPLITRDNLDQLLLLDPLTFSTPQIRLI